MRQSFKLYIDNETAQDGDLEKYLSDAVFSFQMIDEICKKEIEEMFDEGVGYFNMFVKFLFEMYSKLDKSLTDNSLTTEQKARVGSLKSYVKSEIFDPFLVVYIALVGTDSLVEILKSIGDIKVKDFSELMMTLNHEEGIIHSITGRIISFKKTLLRIT